MRPFQAEKLLIVIDSGVLLENRRIPITVIYQFEHKTLFFMKVILLTGLILWSTKSCLLMYKESC